MNEISIYPGDAMNRVAFVALLLLVAVFASAGVSGKGRQRLVGYVDPFVGTGGHGHTYPGATVPSGMIQVSPDTRNGTWDGCSGYHISDSAVFGFSHKHLSGTGCADLGDLLLMPTVTGGKNQKYFPARLVHELEKAEPGYYAVQLPDHDIYVELTATARAGMHRYTVHADQAIDLVVDLVHGIEDSPTEGFLSILNDSTVAGHRHSTGWARTQRFYFVLQFSRPFATWRGTINDVSVGALREIRGTNVRGVLEFPAGQRRLLVRVGISAVSVEGALRNLRAEIPHWDFDRTRRGASDTWETELRKFNITSRDEESKRVFYTAVYHTLLAPVLFNDVDGSYRGADSTIHTSPGFENYHIFSLWDTFRTLNPLYTITQPDRTLNIVKSMLAFGKQSGLLPVWAFEGNETNTMTGYHSVPVIVDAYLKGIRGFDAEEALEAMKKSSQQKQRGLQYYSAQEPKDLAVRFAELRKEGIEPDKAWLATTGRDSSVYLPGFEKAESGESIRYYRSLYPEACDVLLVRAQEGKVIRWQTATIPPQLAQAPVTFVWPVAIASMRGAHAFTVRVNGEHWFTFNSSLDGSQTFWQQEGPKGTRLTFQAQLRDEYADLFGHMYLSVPPGVMPPGKPASIEVQGEHAGSADWFMTYQHALAPGVRATQLYESVREGGATRQLVKLEVERLAPPAAASFHAGSREVATLNLIPGMNVVYLPVDTVSAPTDLQFSAGIGAERVAVVCHLKPFSVFEYIPADREGESVSKTLDYAYDDWCIAQLAAALNKPADRDYYLHRAGFYRNLFDSTSGFMRGRNLDGSWVSPFNPLYGTHKQPQYTESNAWQASWFVPHDIEGLAKLLGGRTRCLAKLDSLFTQHPNLADLGFPPDISGLVGMYAHGNEPSHHTVYLYSLLGRPSNTQELVRRILDSLYAPRPDGLCGNDDCGQMSAWYVMSALGFAPVNPCGGDYVIGVPRFERIRINVGKGKSFEVVAKGLNATHRYVKSVLLNGKAMRGPVIHHTDIVNGGTLTFVMSDRPGVFWEAGHQEPDPSRIR